MFRIISFLIWLLLIIVPLTWFFNNNGWIIITWLGHEVKVDILTFTLLFILTIGLLFIAYRIFFSIISLILGFFGIFKANELKKRDKVIKKYEEIIPLITSYTQANVKKDIKEAKYQEKKIYSILKNKELRDSLIKQTEIIGDITEKDIENKKKPEISFLKSLSLRNIFKKKVSN
jgi:hypothetical protein